MAESRHNGSDDIHGDLEERARIRGLVDRYAEALAEHVTSVRIFVTYESGPEHTGTYSMGDGNWFAQLGYVRHWLLKEEQELRNRAPRDPD